MLYLPELYYLQEQKGFPFRRSVLITATTVSRWCSSFYAQIIAPKSNYTGPLEKSGFLPEDAVEREGFVTELVGWLLDNSSVDDLFCLLLDDEPYPKADKVAKFDHHDDTCCWVLNLTEAEFAHLQAVWQANRLPEDLFYPEHHGVCVPYPGTGLKAKWLRLLGVKKCYTPKQWVNREQTAQPAAAADPPTLALWQAAELFRSAATSLIQYS